MVSSLIGFYTDSGTSVATPFLVGHTETLSDATLCKAYLRAAWPHRCPAKGNSEKRPSCQD